MLFIVFFFCVVLLCERIDFIIYIVVAIVRRFFIFCFFSLARRSIFVVCFDVVSDFIFSLFL